MSKINWQNLFIVAALVMAALGLILPQSIAPDAPVVSPQAFQCAAGTMCVQNGGKTVDMLSGSEFDINAGATFTMAGLKQYAFSFFGNDSSVNGTMIAHGLGATPTYPWCMVYDANWVTATARISSTNATSATLAIFGSDGLPWTTPPVAVRCGAVHVP